MRRAGEVGLSVVALTDHDTISGIAEARARGAETGVRVVAGCEFSARADWGEVHLLGYFLPLEDGELNRRLAAWRSGRHRRAREIVRRLEAHGIVIEFSDVEATADGGAIGRPHVARVMVANGVVPSLDVAFDQWLGWGRAAFVPKELPSVREVTDLVSSLAGVTVLAHPGRRATKNRVHVLRDQGVKGIEVLHPTHDAATQTRIANLADRFEMVPTGGTDWHGDAMRRNERSALGAIRIPSTWFARLEAACE